MNPNGSTKRTKKKKEDQKEQIIGISVCWCREPTCWNMESHAYYVAWKKTEYGCIAESYKGQIVYPKDDDALKDLHNI